MGETKNEKKSLGSKGGNGMISERMNSSNPAQQTQQSKGTLKVATTAFVLFWLFFFFLRYSFEYGHLHFFFQFESDA